MLAALAKDPSLVPRPPSGSSQLPGTAAPGGPAPSSAVCGHVHPYVHTHPVCTELNLFKKSHPFQMLDKNVICSGQRVYCTRVGETSGVTVTLWASPFRSSCSSFTRLLPVSCRRTVGCWHWPSSLRSMLPWRASEVPRTSSKPR